MFNVDLMYPIYYIDEQKIICKAGIYMESTRSFMSPVVKFLLAVVIVLSLFGSSGASLASFYNEHGSVISQFIEFVAAESPHHY